MRRLLALPLVLLTGCPPPGSSTPPPIKELSLGAEGGVRVHLNLEPFEMRIVNAEGREVLRTAPAGEAGSAYGPPSVTVDTPTITPQVIPGWDGYAAGEEPWRHSASARLRARSANVASVEFPVENGVLVLDVRVDGNAVRLHQRPEQPEGLRAGAVYNKASMAFVLPPNEHFFGMGERYAHVDHRGVSLYSWAEEAGTGAGENVPPGPTNPGPNGPSMTYYPVPFALSSQGYAIHLDTTFRSEMHFGSEKTDQWRVAVNSGAFKTTIYVSDDPLESLDGFTRDTGRPIKPAPWIFGNRRRINRGAIRDGVPEWKRMRDLHMPITGIDDSLHFLPHRSELGRETELKQWADTVHANGFKLLGYYNPYVSATDPRATGDFEFGRDHGYFVNDLNGEPSLTFFISGNPQEIAAIDLTNPMAVAWFHSILGRAIALGYDGWMHDFGEYTHRDTIFFNGRYGDEMHNLYPVLSAKAAREYLQRVKPDDHLFFVRSGYTGSQAYVPAVWNGDPEASFDETQGLPAALRSGINLGLTGVPYWGSDAQGYKCVNTGVDRNRELFYRWLQLSAASPVMQDQDRCFALTQELPKWFIWDDEETINEYRRYASFHTRLQPYFLVLAEEAHARGTPIMRHPFLLHPQSPETWSIDDAYYLGPSLYVAPVVKRGQTVKDTWLPPGRFVDLDDHTVYTGDARVQIPAPINKLPVLLKENHLLPLWDPSLETLAPATEPSVITLEKVADRMDVIVALGPNGRAEMMLADGAHIVVTRLQSNAGNSGNLAETTEAELAGCASCFLRGTAGDVTRLRLNTGADASTSELTLDDVQVQVHGGPARRVRFDVLLLN